VGQTVHESLSRKYPAQKRTGGVVQGVGLEFKPQYHKKIFFIPILVAYSSYSFRGTFPPTYPIPVGATKVQSPQLATAVILSTLYGILFATPVALCSNFMTPIYDF
jgi:hypothetical protein